MNLRIAGLLLLIPVLAFAQEFELEISTIPLSEGGRALQIPWNGGLHSLSVALPDIDGDGDLDLLLAGRNNGRVQFYRNDGDGADGQFVFVTGSLNDLYLGDGDNRIAFEDIDGDGDLDLFVGENDGRIRYFRNDGDNQNPDFVLMSDFFNSIDIGNISAPAFSDLNGDGLNDLIVGSYREGLFYHTRNNAMTTGFAFVDTLRDATGAMIKSGTQFYVPAFVDIDGDNDLDLLCGSSSNAIALYTNTGTATEHRFELFDENYIVPPLSMSYLTLALADIDGDLDVDLFVGSNHGYATFYRNEGDPTAPDFVLESEKLDLEYFDLGFRSFPVMVDIDDDADLDLFVGAEQGRVAFLQNTGSAQNPAFEYVKDLITPFSRRSLYPTFGDLDGDDDKDLLVGPQRGNILYYENIGSSQVGELDSVGVLVDESGAQIPGDRPELGDLDGDGDLDLFTTVTGGDGAILRYENTGTPNTPTFSATPDTLRDEDGTVIAEWDSYFRYADWDSDADLDLFIGEANGSVIFYENVGTATTPAFRLINETFGDIDMGNNARCAPFLADIDSDGDLDAFVGRFMGGLYFYRNTGVPVGIAERNAELPTTVALRNAYPNPFSSSTKLSFLLSERTTARLIITDVMGRRVRELLNGRLEAGVHEAIWNGRDDSGIRVASGVYYLRLETERSNETMKLVLVRN